MIVRYTNHAHMGLLSHPDGTPVSRWWLKVRLLYVDQGFPTEDRTGRALRIETRRRARRLQIGGVR